MESLISFESTSKKKIERQQLKEARRELLDKAKTKFEKEEWKKEQARLRGEGTWMLPSLSERIVQDEQTSKKKKKKKTTKKQKKKSRKKSSSTSDLDSDNEEPQWIEKTTSKSSVSENQSQVKGPQLQRDSWMTEAPDFFPAISRQEIRDAREKEKGNKKEENVSIDELGQHKLELNPYWKDGGTGLPTEEKTAKFRPTIAGDGGISWLRKSYQRCLEQSKEEGRPLAEIAAERYGSLENLEAMLVEAERKVRDNREARQSERARGNGRKSSNHNMNNIEKSNDLSRNKAKRSRSRDRRSRSRDRRSRSRDRRSRSRDRRSRDRRSRSRDRRSRNREKSRSRDRRSRSRERRSRSRGRRSRSRDRRSRSRDRRSRSRERSRSRDRRSRSRDRRSRSRDRISRSRDRRSRSRGSVKGSKECHKSGGRYKNLAPKFVRPDGDSDGSVSKYPSGFRKPGDTSTWTQKPVKSSGGWMKKHVQEPNESTGDNKHSKDLKDADSLKKRRYSSSSESPSASSSASEDEIEAEPETVIMSEEEMNKIGAKILKAELMGDQATADKLKSQLDVARKAKEAMPKDAVIHNAEKTVKDGDEDNTVLLTRTDHRGNVRPVATGEHVPENKRSRKRKKKDTGFYEGQRQQYFHDDDKFDLKDLVRQEKMNTAEDSNAMFARLAGKSFEKTDDDHQLDDVFMQRASKAESGARAEERDRNAAIAEHSRMSKAMDKCSKCLENAQKHLIIAIGMKVYLCLPEHRSMTDGHCLLVPMQHTPCGTAMDEDVWQEIQIFRKGLTRLFQDRNEDAVFMEMASGLKYHPHAVVECVPVPKETGDMAPIYFKKAIQETGEEWAQNKKLVDLKGRNVRKAVPKGFPYFSVDFGLDSGYAHVIENEQTFPKYFGREILGGMLDLEPLLWRKPHRQNFDDQRKKVLQFAEWWKPYDWTRRLKSTD